jgi:hypothetical protein
VVPAFFVSGLWRENGSYDEIMPRTQGAPALLIVLCLLAGFAALAGLSSAAAVLLFGLGLMGLVAALGFGVVAVGAALWAAVLAFGGPPSPA